MPGDSFFRNIRALAGREKPFETREGLPAAELATAQRDLLAEIIDAYTAEHLAAPFASSVTTASWRTVTGRISPSPARPKWAGPPITASMATGC